MSLHVRSFLVYFATAQIGYFAWVLIAPKAPWWVGIAVASIAGFVAERRWLRAVCEEAAAR